MKRRHWNSVMVKVGQTIPFTHKSIGFDTDHGQCLGRFFDQTDYKRTVVVKRNREGRERETSSFVLYLCYVFGYTCHCASATTLLTPSWCPFVSWMISLVWDTSYDKPWTMAMGLRLQRRQYRYLISRWRERSVAD